jgi:hypothetical protein
MPAHSGYVCDLAEDATHAEVSRQCRDLQEQCRGLFCQPKLGSIPGAGLLEACGTPDAPACVCIPPPLQKQLAAAEASASAAAAERDAALSDTATSLELVRRETSAAREAAERSATELQAERAARESAESMLKQLR